MTLVVDSSMVSALVSGVGDHTRWALGLVRGEDLVAPHLMPVETANVLRRLAARGRLDPVTAGLAMADLLALDIELFPFAPFASRVWALRNSVTAYDAWYVALAESLDAPLATLDRRLSQAPGTRCAFRTPFD